MAAHIDERREPQALAAGVFEAMVDGVICGVGRGPIRASSGVGGTASGLSSNRASTVAGVGVVS